MTDNNFYLSKMHELHPTVKRVGADMKKDQQNKICEIVQKAVGHYKADIQSQIQFIVYHVQQLWGKYVQVIIFSSQCQQGHQLFCVNNRFIRLQFKGFVYMIWNVKLKQN